MEKEKNILELKQKLETFESPDQYINSLKERIMIMEQENNKLENLLKEKVELIFLKKYLILF